MAKIIVSCPAAPPGTYPLAIARVIRWAMRHWGGWAPGHEIETNVKSGAKANTLK